MLPTSVDLSASYDALVQTYLGMLERIAQGWLLSGATCFALMQGERVLFIAPPEGQPTSHDLIEALPSNELGGINLSITIKREPANEARLQADASLVAQLLTLECELNVMTQELVTQQDQLLALYDLNHALDQCFELIPSLAVMAQISQRLTQAESAVAALLIDGQIVENRRGLAVTAEMLQAAFEMQGSRPWQTPVPGIGYVLYVPIQVRKRPGVLALTLGYEFSSPQIKLMRAVAEQGRTHLDNVLLHEEQVAQTRLQTEVELARSVQTRLQPRPPRPQPKIDLFGASIAARHVGGDFFDYMLKPNAAPLIIIGDVAGKGLPAALVMTMARTAIRGAIGAGLFSPEKIMSHVNNDLYDDFTELGLFTTAFVARYEAEPGELIYANAGHSPIVCYVPGEGARIVEAEDTALGVLPGYEYGEQRLTLPPGGLLVAATDGFVEAENILGDRFGYQPFLREIERYAHLSAEALTEHLFTVVRDYRGDVPQSDDLTMIVFKRTE